MSARSPRERRAEQGSPTPCPAEHLPSTGGANQASSAGPTLFVPWGGPRPTPSPATGATVWHWELRGGDRGEAAPARRSTSDGREGLHAGPARHQGGGEPWASQGWGERRALTGIPAGENAAPSTVTPETDWRARRECPRALGSFPRENWPSPSAPQIPSPRPGPRPGTTGRGPWAQSPAGHSAPGGQSPERLVSPQLPRSSRSADPSPTRPSPTTP